MNEDLRAAAERRLLEAADARGLEDPRPPYREALKRLRENDADAFEQAVVWYSGEVLPRLGREEPLAVWVEYGLRLTGPGARAVSIDEQGRATDLAAGSADNATDVADSVADAVVAGSAQDTDNAADAAGAPMVLLIPAETSDPVLPALVPRQPSPAQRATMELLVNRALSLPE